MSDGSNPSDVSSELTDSRLSVTRRVPASAARVFAVVSDPKGHVDIDGSGMLVTAPDAKPLQQVGDTFAMDMDREPLGDVPLGKYKVLNTVTKIVPDVEIQWNVGSAEHRPIGHVYGYLLEPVGDNETQVTNYCDWSDVSDKWRARISWPVVPASMMSKSLDRLAQVVADRS